MTEQENQDKNKIVNELNTLISNICDEEHSCRRRKCQDCKLDYIADYILHKAEEVKKETLERLYKKYNDALFMYILTFQDKTVSGALDIFKKLIKIEGIEVEE